MILHGLDWFSKSYQKMSLGDYNYNMIDMSLRHL